MIKLLDILFEAYPFYKGYKPSGKKGINKAKMSKYQIYCDMDGVLTDHDKKYYELTGINLKGNFIKADKFWGPINREGSKFWSDLEWMPGGKQLWNYIKHYHPILLTAPSPKESSKKGKREWIDREINSEQHVIFEKAKKKHLHSGKNKILIDDREDTIDSWNKAGGIGILYINTKDVIAKLKKLGL